MNCLAILEEVFGQKSRAYLSFAALPWGVAGQMLVDPDEMEEDEMGRLEGTNEYLSRRHTEAARTQLGTASGILSGAADDLRRKGLASAYVVEETGNEASELLRVIRLIERQWRKGMLKKPASEKDAQDALEVLFVGAELVYGRENETIAYSSKMYKPDFTIAELDLAIEVKLCYEVGREKDLIAEVNDDVLAYSKRYKNILFAIYDLGFIRDTERFAGDLEKQSGIIVRVIKH